MLFIEIFTKPIKILKFILIYKDYSYFNIKNDLKINIY